MADGDRRRTRGLCQVRRRRDSIPLGLVVLVGLTWAFFQHLLSGMRHLVLDTGAGYELNTNRFFAVMTIAGSLFLTALTWVVLMGVDR